MKGKITLDMLEAIINEVDKAISDELRTISDIQNRDVQLIVQEYSDYALKNNLNVLEIITDVVERGGIAVGGTIIGSIVAIKGATVGTAIGTTAGTTAFIVAAKSTAIGTTVGSTVPVVGTLIGAGVGLLAGVLIGGAINAKKNHKRECEYQEAIVKQNAEIKELLNSNEHKDEEIARLKYIINHQVSKINELSKRLEKTNEENAHLKYIIGVLLSWRDINNLICSC